MDAATAALAAPVLTGNTNATNKPQRSSTLKLLNQSFNAFGGILRWVAAPGEEISIVGNTASLGELSLSSFTGSTAFAGQNFQVDASGSNPFLGPTKVKIITPGTYWVFAGGKSQSVITLGFQFFVFEGGSHAQIGGEWGYNLNCVVPPLISDAFAQNSHVWILDASDVATGQSFGVRVNHNSSELMSIAAELTIVKIGGTS